MLIKDVDQLTPETLTAVLRFNGFLTDHEHVASVRTLKTYETSVSRAYRMAVRYERVASIKNAPIAIFLKLAKPGIPPEFADKEVRFYRDLTSLMYQRFDKRDLPLLRCYDAHYEADEQRSHLILDDIGETHYEAKNNMPPSERHYQMVVEGLAHLHAYWWQHPDLSTYTPLHTDDSLAQSLDAYAEKYAQFKAHMQHRVPMPHHAYLQAIVNDYPPQRRQNMLDGKRITLVHRDTHPNNIMYAFDSIKLLDWQSWRADTGTDDIAYFIACHFPEPARRFQTRKLLQTYWNTLQKLGLRDYSWDDCWYDYQASVARCIAFLLRAWQPGQRFERGLQALKAFEEIDGMAIYR